MSWADSLPASSDRSLASEGDPCIIQDAFNNIEQADKAEKQPQSLDHSITSIQSELRVDQMPHPPPGEDELM